MDGVIFMGFGLRNHIGVEYGGFPILPFYIVLNHKAERTKELRWACLLRQRPVELYSLVCQHSW